MRGAAASGFLGGPAGLAAAALLALALPHGALAQRAIDAERTLRVEAELYRHPELFAVEVQSMMGFVYLRGTAPDASAVEKGVALAAAVEGVREVRNRIRLRQPGTAEVPDSEIAARVAEIVTELPGLDATVREGRVAVRGEAPDVLRAHELIARLRRVEGIRSLELSELRTPEAAP
jgi:hypothetical protein